MSESKDIKKQFVRLRDWGCIVFNYNSNKPNNAGIKGHPDWLILTSKMSLVFIEVKIGKDKVSEDQHKVINRLASIMGLPNSKVYIFIVHNVKEAEILSDRIQKREL